MEINQYNQPHQKKPIKPNQEQDHYRRLLKKYLEAEETLFQELEVHRIGYRRKFKFESTKIQIWFLYCEIRSSYWKLLVVHGLLVVVATR